MSIKGLGNHLMDIDSQSIISKEYINMFWITPPPLNFYNSIKRTKILKSSRRQSSKNHWNPNISSRKNRHQDTGLQMAL
ncbi:hypothetical protein FKM82_016631 [Ascaphus truei]